jgi:hypothetical protein
MSTRIPKIDLQGERAILKVKNIDASVAAIDIDEKAVGYFVSNPYEVDITKEISAGGKVLSITLYGTLRNLLGPHHHIDGELLAVGPDYFKAWQGEYEASPEIPKWAIKWGIDGHCPSQWRDSYCMVSFANIGSVSIYRKRD